LIGDNSGPLDYYNLKLEKAPATYDYPRVVKAYVNYELPIGRGRKALANAPWLAEAVLGGWSFAAILNYASGAPLGFSAPSPLSGGWNGALNRANVAAGALGATGFDKRRFELSTAGSPNVGLFSAITRRKRSEQTISESARCARICRMLHFSGDGTKSNSAPAAPVITAATRSGPRRKRCSNSESHSIANHYRARPPCRPAPDSGS